MRHLLLSFVCGLLLSGSAVAQFCVPQEAETFYQKAMSQINQRHVTWVKNTASTIKKNGLTPNDLRRMAASYRSQVSMGDMDIEALISLTLMLVAKDSNEDLKQMLENLKKLNEQKKQFREAINKLKQTKERQKQMLRSEYDSLKRLLENTPGRINVITSKTNNASFEEIKELLDKMMDKRDSMNEMSEMDMLSLQKHMERMSQFEQMISNIMKAISDTQNTIIQNLK